MTERTHPLWSPDLWDIIDPATGKTADQAGYFSPLTAQSELDSWLHRQARGGRPDISREWLESLIVVQRTA